MREIVLRREWARESVYEREERECATERHYVCERDCVLARE